MTAIVYDVPGISCGHCKRAIETELAAIPDLDVEVDVDARTVTVRGVIDDPTIRAAIEEAGYEVAATRAG